MGPAKILSGVAYLAAPHSLVDEMSSHPPDQLNLLFWRQARDGRLEHTPERRLVDDNERVIVHIRKETHDELAVHAIRHATVAGDRVAKVLELEGPLETGREEAAERSNQGRKSREGEGVELDWGDGKGEVRALREEEEFREFVGRRNEDGVHFTLETGEESRAEVLNGSATSFHSEPKR